MSSVPFESSAETLGKMLVKLAKSCKPNCAISAMKLVNKWVRNRQDASDHNRSIDAGDGHISIGYGNMSGVFRVEDPNHYKTFMLEGNVLIIHNAPSAEHTITLNNKSIVVVCADADETTPDQTSGSQSLMKVISLYPGALLVVLNSACKVKETDCVGLKLSSVGNESLRVFSSPSCMVTLNVPVVDDCDPFELVASSEPFDDVDAEPFDDVDAEPFDDVDAVTDSDAVTASDAVTSDAVASDAAAFEPVNAASESLVSLIWQLLQRNTNYKEKEDNGCMRCADCFLGLDCRN
jgi:hypothetical protein